MSYSKPTAKLDFRSWNSALRPACTAGWLVCSDSSMHVLTDEGLTYLTHRNPAAFRVDISFYWIAYRTME